MKKKIIYSIIALAVLAAVLFGYNRYIQSQTIQGSKTLTIEIKANDEILFQEEVSTDALFLREVVLELVAQNRIKLDYEDGQFGMYIKALGKDQLVSEDPAKGLYWVYESPNNKQCVAASFCDAADQLAIEDQDHIIFILKTFN